MLTLIPLVDILCAVHIESKVKGQNQQVHDGQVWSVYSIQYKCKRRSSSLKIIAHIGFKKYLKKKKMKKKKEIWKRVDWRRSDKKERKKEKRSKNTQKVKKNAF